MKSYQITGAFIGVVGFVIIAIYSWQVAMGVAILLWGNNVQNAPEEENENN